jgi:redox-sensitive bicupin YhaK (pirin superfamily)
MEAGASWLLPKASAGINRKLYFYKGSSLQADSNLLNEYHSAELVSTADILLECGSEPGRILILQGKPINEPVVQYGPFVMNSKQEIQEAFQEFQQTEFGGWPWPVYDPVHPKEKGRFALKSDGTLEMPT